MIHGSKATYQRYACRCRECTDAAVESNRAWVKANPEKMKAYRRKSLVKRTYGITVEDIEAMRVAQNGLCALCGQPPSPTSRDHKQLLVDHDHVTGKVRALLCNRCNRALGMMGDDPDLLEAAARYLRSHSG